MTCSDEAFFLLSSYTRPGDPAAVKLATQLVVLRQAFRAGISSNPLVVKNARTDQNRLANLTISKRTLGQSDFIRCRNCPTEIHSSSVTRISVRPSKNSQQTFFFAGPEVSFASERIPMANEESTFKTAFLKRHQHEIFPRPQAWAM